MQDNYGLILDNRTDERDLFFGANERVNHKYTVSDWLPYYSVGELQHGTYFDTMSCVTFATLNILEAKFNYLLDENILSDDNLKWLNEKGYIENGKFNFSDRFIASLSGTTNRGNNARNVWNAIRKYGLVSEKICDWDRSRDVVYEERFPDWYRDPKNVSQEALDLGKEFLERFNILYERVYRADYFEAVKHSPLLVFISTGCPKEGDMQMACDKTTNHAVSLPNANGEFLKLFDHYHKNPIGEGQEKFLRKVSKDFLTYSFGYSCSVSEKEPKEDKCIMKLIKTAGDPRIWAVTKTKERMHIPNMPNLYAGSDIAGIWGKEHEEVTQEELDAYPVCDVNISFTINKNIWK